MINLKRSNGRVRKRTLDLATFEHVEALHIHVWNDIHMINDLRTCRSASLSTVDRALLIKRRLKRRTWEAYVWEQKKVTGILISLQICIHHDKMLYIQSSFCPKFLIGAYFISSVYYSLFLMLFLSQNTGMFLICVFIFPTLFYRTSKNARISTVNRKLYNSIWWRAKFKNRLT